MPGADNILPLEFRLAILAFPLAGLASRDLSAEGWVNLVALDLLLLENALSLAADLLDFPGALLAHCHVVGAVFLEGGEASIKLIDPEVLLLHFLRLRRIGLLNVAAVHRRAHRLVR